jgi:Ca2+/Na+ antiporter
MNFLKNRITMGIVLLTGIFLIFIGAENIPIAVIEMVLGFLIVVIVSEPMIEGLKNFSQATGFSPHITGVISSLASNLPEGVMTVFMVLSPELREVAILAVLLASAFNGLLLGILVIMLTYKGGAIEMPREAMEHDIEIMRIAIALCVIVFGSGIILNIFCTIEGVILPIEVPIFLLLAYIGYIFFLSRKENDEKVETEIESDHNGGWLLPVSLGLVGIIIAAELISGSSEFLVHIFDLHVVIAATIIGFAGSVPEHGIAVLGARKGHVEIGVSNLLSGITQSIMLIFPLLALIVPVKLDGYVIYQFMAIAVTLWIVKKSIIDDHRLTLDEGFSIILIHVLGILLFDELSFLI